MSDPLPGHDYYKGMLSIPYVRWAPHSAPDKKDWWSVVSLRFRCIDPTCTHDWHGKYNTLPGDRPRLFNTVALSSANDVIHVCEGELDTMTATQVGLDAVGVPGVQTWEKWFAEPFLGYEVVYVLADGDDPGREFARFLGQKLPNAVIIPMPTGKDVNDVVNEQGPDALLERINR